MIIVKNPFGSVPATLTYALKIDDYESFKQFIDGKINCAGCTQEQIDKKVDDITKASVYKYGSDMSTFEKTFLELNDNCGFSNYKANDELTNWSKLKLNLGVVVPEPCND